MKKIAVYGSLRQGQYNNLRFQQMYGHESFNHVRTTVFKGYDLYSLGPYPAAIPGKGELVVDIFEVSDDLFERLDAMERSADYFPVELFLRNGDEHEFINIWLYQPKGHSFLRENAPIVRSGDWTKYLNNEN